MVAPFTQVDGRGGQEGWERKVKNSEIGSTGFRYVGNKKTCSLGRSIYTFGFQDICLISVIGIYLVPGVLGADEFAQEVYVE